MFDYIRTINSLDPTLPVDSVGYPNNDFAAGTPSSGNVLGGGISIGAGQVVPTEINSGNKVNGQVWNTQGFGAFPVLTEADLQFVAIGANTNTVTGAPATPVFTDQIGSRGTIITNSASSSILTTTGMLTNNINLPPTNSVAVQAYLLLNFVNPNHWFPWTHAEPIFYVEVSGLNGFFLNGYPLFSVGGTASPNTDCAIAGGFKFDSITTGLSGVFDFRSMVADRVLGPGTDVQPISGLTNYPFYSSIMGITNVGSMALTANPAVTNTVSTPITITIYEPSNTSYSSVAGLTRGDPVQTYTINFPNTTVPVPSLALFRRIGTPWGDGYGGTNGGSNEKALGSSAATANSDRWRDLYADGAAGSAWEMATYFQVNNNVSHFVSGTYNGQDVVEGMVLSPAWSDPRMLALSNVPSAAFAPHPNYGSVLTNFAYGTKIFGTPCPGAGIGYLTKSAGYAAMPVASPSISSSVGATTTAGTVGDWDNGMMSYPDGPYINKTDEGNQNGSQSGSLQGIAYYQWNQQYSSTNGVYFSPNRQVPSPVMFGSLPTGVDPAGIHPAGWQTLLFHPGPTGHPGATSPEDELLLDLFWMPVTDPYPISEAFSTAGKVNLNYEIVPFSYINRSTAVRAVLSSEKVTAIPTSKASVYKTEWSSANTLGTTPGRCPLNLGSDVAEANGGDDGGTLEQFNDLFSGQGAFKDSSGNPMIFHSPAQICDMYLIPQASALTGAINWNTPSAAQSGWYSSSFGLVGDNERERPYADIYGRVTTKSNTFKVHFTVQSIKPAPSDLASGQWNESRGAVTGQYIGSSTIERYIDPTSSSIQDYAALSNPLSVPNLESAYRWRVVEQHQFVP